MTTEEQQNLMMLRARIDALREEATERLLTEPNYAGVLTETVKSAISQIRALPITPRLDCPVGSERDPVTGLCKVAP